MPSGEGAVARGLMAMIVALVAGLTLAFWGYDRVQAGHADFVRLGLEPEDVEHARRLCWEHGRGIDECERFTGSAASVEAVLGALD